MNHHHRAKTLIVVAGLAVLLLAGPAQAIIIDGCFPIFGVVNGLQVARLNVVLSPPPDTDFPCPVTLAFIDGNGTPISPEPHLVRGGAAVHADFIGNPDARVGDRLQIRAQVTVGDPNEFIGCAGKTLVASVEVVDRLTRATHIILTNPLLVETATRQ